MRRVITYGTFDLLHYGHINLLRRAKEQGDYLIVALSTDEFNWEQKQKKSYFSYEDRKLMLEAIRYVDLVIPEESWDQKITDVEKKRKFVCVDTNDIPEVAVVDPDMMSSMPKGLTAATGMDALTHAIEGYITKGHCTISDMFHLEAIKLISENLRGAVQNTPEGREGMALGQYIAGMGFSNVGLGIVHSMAHGLSALYDTPHGVACAIILPTGLEYNKAAAGERYRAVGKAMGVKDIDEMNDAEAADATIAEVKKLSADVGIPADLKGILKEEDIQFLAESAFADACCPGNPRDTSVEEIKELYRSLM